MSLVVLKVGGASAAGAADAVLGLDRVCVVHGAGPQISAEMQRRGLPVEFIGGRRVTTAAGLEVVRESFAAVNAELCASIGAAAVPLFGDEIGLCARRVPGLGLVGDPVPCAPAAVVDALANGLVPVIAPLAAGPLNVNADEMAAALAVGLHADRLLFVTDVQWEGRSLASCGSDLTHQFLQLVLVACRQGDRRPRLGQFQRTSTADALRCTRHQRYPA